VRGKKETNEQPDADREEKKGDNLQLLLYQHVVRHQQKTVAVFFLLCFEEKGDGTIFIREKKRRKTPHIL